MTAAFSAGLRLILSSFINATKPSGIGEPGDVLDLLVVRDTVVFGERRQLDTGLSQQPRDGDTTEAAVDEDVGKPLGMCCH